jgi:hypothetical protein
MLWHACCCCLGMGLTFFSAALLVIPMGIATPAEPATAAPIETAAAVATKPCRVRWWFEARYRGYGYDHLVHLHNDCGFPVVCAVSTNVNPKTFSATVGARSHRTVVTWTGSPSRVFVATVVCRAE